MMKVWSCSIPVLLPLFGLVVGLATLPTACSDTECTSGTVRMDIALPESPMAAAVDVAFEIAGQIVHSERLLVTAGASTVSADIVLPAGYPAGQSVVVTAVAKRLEGGMEVPVGTWFAAQVFPAGCIGFVVSLFPINMADGGGSDASFVFPDGGFGDASVVDSSPDGAGPTDGATDAANNDGSADTAASDAGGTPDADVDAPAI